MNKLILPTRELAEMLASSSKDFFTPHGLDIPPLKSWIDILEVAVSDYFHTRCKWNDSGKTLLPATLREKFEWFDEACDFSNCWYMEVFDPFDLRIMELLNKVGGLTGWEEWSISVVAGDLVVVIQEDHRILEWHRQNGVPYE
jgi:hypothetical protein